MRADWTATELILATRPYAMNIQMQSTYAALDRSIFWAFSMVVLFLIFLRSTGVPLLK